MTGQDGEPQAVGDPFLSEVYGLRGVPGQIPEGTEKSLSGRQPGADAGGIFQTAGNSQKERELAAVLRDDDHMQHGDTDRGTEIYHCGGSQERAGGDRLKGKGEADPDTQGAADAAGRIYEKRTDHVGAGLLQPVRKPAGPQQRVQRDEEPLRSGRDQRAESISS